MKSAMPRSTTPHWTRETVPRSSAWVSVKQSLKQCVPLLGLAGVLFLTPVQAAEGMPSLAEVDVTKIIEANKEKARAAEEQFESSDFLQELRQRSEDNKEKNRREIENKYCLRQAELGIGDCAGLKDVPGGVENLRKARNE